MKKFIPVWLRTFGSGISFGVLSCCVWQLNYLHPWILLPPKPSIQYRGKMRIFNPYIKEETDDRRIHMPGWTPRPALLGCWEDAYLSTTIQSDWRLVGALEWAAKKMDISLVARLILISSIFETYALVYRAKKLDLNNKCWESNPKRKYMLNWMRKQNGHDKENWHYRKVIKFPLLTINWTNLMCVFVLKVLAYNLSSRLLPSANQAWEKCYSTRHLNNHSMLMKASNQKRGSIFTFHSVLPYK